MMMKQVLLLFCFASALTLSLSESKSASLQPHAVDSFDVGYIQMKGAQNCSYLVKITTSCSSPKFTTDEVSIVFGDASGNKVYAPRLDDPISRTFEQCSSDSFQIDGPCASPICVAYLYGSGADDNGWKPETVKIYGFDSNPVTFNFNTSIPSDTWYGYDLCDTPPPPPHHHHPPPPSPPPPHPHPPSPSPPPHPPPPPPPSPPPPPPPHHHPPPPPPSPPPHPPPPPPPSPPPPHHHHPPPPSPPPHPPPPPPPSPPPPPPPPPSPHPHPPPPPPPPPPHHPPPHPPPSSSNQLSIQKWLVFMVVGFIFSILM